jgi:hypothetical protein
MLAYHSSHSLHFIHRVVFVFVFSFQRCSDGIQKLKIYAYASFSGNLKLGGWESSVYDIIAHNII